MASELTTPFTRYILSPEEELAGTQFNELQRMFIQNLIADAAEEKVRLTFNPVNPNAFIQREAELQGIIICLQNLLAENKTRMEDVIAAQSQPD